MRKLTSSLFFGLAFCILSVSSCKKEQDSTPAAEYYVKFKLDGVDKEYSEIASAVFTTTVPLHTCSMVGVKQISDTIYEGMQMWIASDTEIVANITYTDAIVLGRPAASIAYNDGTGEQFSSVIAASSGVQAVITHMDDNTVTGTFSGTVVSYTDFTTSHVVTGGQFHLPRF
ncbi:MAG TPA: hypothetical protein VEV83_13975 [Parafilimonas sp.]|nr:hypothetical protein [Parafilimonas sp.]